MTKGVGCVGDTVRRPQGPTAATNHQLLLHHTLRSDQPPTAGRLDRLATKKLSGNPRNRVVVLVSGCAEIEEALAVRERERVSASRTAISERSAGLSTGPTVPPAAGQPGIAERWRSGVGVNEFPIPQGLAQPYSVEGLDGLACVVAVQWLDRDIDGDGRG